jgi:SAM-dependent methyltransferase
MSQPNFVAGHYAARARAYVTSAVHSAGADLDQIEAELRGLGATREAARVLDLGCGGGHVSYRAAPLVAQVVACDITQSMLDEVARTAAELCRFTAHHWQAMEAGLREVRRVIKQTGRAVFVDSVAPADRTLDTHLQAVELLRDPSHVRNYSTAEWVSALSRSGFSLDSITIRTLRMEFPIWIARTRTPKLHAEAIRSLQGLSPDAVRAHFAIEDDGSFDLEAATMVVLPS